MIHLISGSTLNNLTSGPISHRRHLFARITILTIFFVGHSAVSGIERAPQVQHLLKTYCFECHSPDARQGNLDLESIDPDRRTEDDRLLWWKVLKNLRTSVMPPVGQPRPTSEELETISDWIKFDVFGINANDPDPGRNIVRRLNRREYDNTVDDLMGIKFDASLIFPPDDSGFGFDNVGEALSVSPMLMEKYLRSAQAIVDRAVPRQTWVMPYQEFFGHDFQDQDRKVRGSVLSSKSPATVRRIVQIKEAGTYDLHLVVKLHGSFEFDPSRYSIRFTIDGVERSNHEYGWDENKPFHYSFVEDWAAGDHELTFELTPVPVSSESDDAPKAGVGRESTFVHFEVNSVRIEGPRGTTRLVHPRNYARFFHREEPPSAQLERRSYATEILRQFATRAFRCSVDQQTIDRLVKLAEREYEQADKTFESGIAHAMVAILSSPRFLFRLESFDRTSTDQPYSQISDAALASRLSYFLWSTMPDDELARLATTGELRNQLPAQLKRMLGSDRLNEFSRNFVGQWLRTRDVTQVSVDPIAVMGLQEEYQKLQEQFRSRRRRPLTKSLNPEDETIRKRFGEFRAMYERFDDDMKQSMRRETEMSVEYLMKEDRSLLDLLDCDYTFVNEKLATLYNIPDVRGKEMRRVALPNDSPRGGILSQASMLLITSNPTRTSPVKRGLFILENILGTPTPPAPPGVPDLEEASKKFGDQEPPLRELLRVHRESPTCSSCHSRMDPLGLALENFNALGMWRDQEKQQPIDAAGQLITGESFHDIRELKKILREQHALDFYRCVTEKMLTYALGRGMEPTDQQTIDLIVDRLKQNNGKFSELILGVIESAPFQKQRRWVQSASSN